MTHIKCGYINCIVNLKLLKYKTTEKENIYNNHIKRERKTNSLQREFPKKIRIQYKNPFWKTQSQSTRTTFMSSSAHIIITLIKKKYIKPPHRLFCKQVRIKFIKMKKKTLRRLYDHTHQLQIILS